MIGIKNMTRYNAFKAKCQGYSHKSTGMSCQDAVEAIFGNFESGGSFAICAAADGHGSPKYFRCDTGAEIAVKIAVDSVKRFIAYQRQSQSYTDSIYSCEALSEDNFTKLLKDVSAHIVAKWIDEIKKHWISVPCTEEEKLIFEAQYPNQSVDDIDVNVAKIYGTTLIFGALTDEYTFAVQCGDGAVCIISEEGEAFIPEETVDDNQIGSMANSLSSSNCLNLFKYYFSENKPKAMIFVSDGVIESYGGNEGKDFLNFCVKVVEQYEKDYEQAQGFLEDWLPKLSEKGSEDDMSVVGVYGNYEL